MGAGGGLPHPPAPYPEGLVITHKSDQGDTEGMDWDDPARWAEQMWGQAALGDARRTKRVVALATQCATLPDAQLPEQCGSWAALKGAYRFLSNPHLSATQLNQPVWDSTRDRAQQVHGHVLFIQDDTELNFTHHPHTTGLGLGGNPRQRGLMLHSTLCVQPHGAPEHLQVLGVAQQFVWIRPQSRQGEARAQRYERWNESDVWGEALETCTPPQPHWISVSDRGSDDFSYFRQAAALRWRIVARAAQTRRVFTTSGQPGSLFPESRQSPSLATVALHRRGRDGQPAQTISVQVSFTALTLRPPKHGPEQHQAPLPMWVVRAWSGDGRHEWILLTSVPVQTIEDALEIVSWYAHRWVIEEFHKALKTGCQFEARQLETAAALQRLLALLSPIAARLLALRGVSRAHPDDAATTVVPVEVVTLVMRKLRSTADPQRCTLRTFWHGVAQIGGFVNRAGDGEPGWQTLWRGWHWLLEATWLLDLPGPDAALPTCG